MIRATLDVNVPVSGVPAARGVPSELLARWSSLQFELVLSEHILGELADVWSRPYWRARYDFDQAQNAIRRLQALGLCAWSQMVRYGALPPTRKTTWCWPPLSPAGLAIW